MQEKKETTEGSESYLNGNDMKCLFQNLVLRVLPRYMRGMDKSSLTNRHCMYFFGGATKELLIYTLKFHLVIKMLVNIFAILPESVKRNEIEYIIIIKFAE